MSRRNTARDKARSADVCLPDDLPGAFLDRMKQTLSEEDFSAFLSSYGKPPVKSLRLNTLHGAGRSSLPFDLSDTPVPWEPNGFCYRETPATRPGRHPLHEAGAYYIQEASAMLPARLLLRDLLSDGTCRGDTSPDAFSYPAPRVLDLCAAPGGKSVQLAMMLENRGLLISNEIHPTRARILSQNIERMGILNCIVTNETPERLAARFPAFFDCILVDAPCSGEGMFRKNPPAIREWSPEAVSMCARRQADILDRAADMLSPGGRLVYATCTFAPAEDEEQIRRFLARHTDFSLSEQRKLLPHEVCGEGHFCALLIREGTPVRFHMADISASRADGMPHNRPDRALTGTVSTWLDGLLADASAIGFAKERLLLFGEHLWLLPPGSPDLTGIKALRPGLHLADVRTDRSGPRLFPAHALSHAIRLEDARLHIALTEEDALSYLRGQTLRPEQQPGFPDRSLPDGCAREQADAWLVVTYRGLPLGWVKYSGGALKNHYPKGLRISC